MKTLTVWTAGICLFLVLGCVERKNKGIELDWRGETHLFEFRYVPQPQPVNERRWKTITVRRIPTDWYEKEDLLYLPVEIQSDAVGNLYVLDQGDRKIKKFDPEGRFLKELGPGEGRGPGELQLPFDLAVDTAGNLYVSDLRRRSLVSMDPEGEYRWQEFYKHDSPGRVAAGSDRVILDAMGFNTPSPFRAYTAEGIKMHEYEPVVTDPPDADFPPYISLVGKPLTGRFVPYREGRMIFAPRYIAHLIFYDPAGNIDFAVETIDRVPLPRKTFKDGLEKMSSGKSFVKGSFSGEVSSLNINILGDAVILWSSPGNDQYGTHVLDFYDADDGRYQYSLRIPEIGGISDLLITPNKIYTLNAAKGQMQVWAIEKAPWI